LKRLASQAMFFYLSVHAQAILAFQPNKKPFSFAEGFQLVENSSTKSNQFIHSLGLSDTKNEKIPTPNRLDIETRHDGTLTQSAKHIEPQPEKKRIRDMSNLEAFALLENDLLLIMAFFAFLCGIGHVTAKLMERESREQ